MAYQLEQLREEQQRVRTVQEQIGQVVAERLEPPQLVVGAKLSQVSGW